MTLNQAKSLTYGQEVHYTGRRACLRKIGARGGVYVQVTRCRVSGAVQTWKRSPERIRVPVKHGLYESSAITEWNLSDWHLGTECPVDA